MKKINDVLRYIFSSLKVRIKKINYLPPYLSLFSGIGIAVILPIVITVLFFYSGNYTFGIGSILGLCVIILIALEILKMLGLRKKGLNIKVSYKNTSILNIILFICILSIIGLLLNHEQPGFVRTFFDNSERMWAGIFLIVALIIVYSSDKFKSRRTFVTILAIIIGYFWIIEGTAEEAKGENVVINSVHPSLDTTIHMSQGDIFSFSLNATKDLYILPKKSPHKGWSSTICWTCPGGQQYVVDSTGRAHSINSAQNYPQTLQITYGISTISILGDPIDVEIKILPRT